MLESDDLLTNFTNAGLKICADEFGLNLQETSKYDPRYKFPTNHKQEQGSKDPLDSLT